MKRFMLVWISPLLTLMLAACGSQSNPILSSADIQMSMNVEMEPITVGETTLSVTLADASGMPIDGAILQVHGDMDHEGMTPVDREISQSTSGEYRVPFEWTMGGGWIVTVTAQLPNNGSEISKNFEFFVEAVSSESIINRHDNVDTATTPINISYQPDNDPAIGGDAIVTIGLTDASGQPIPDAFVEVIGDMAHEGMMPISGTGEHISDGNYSVPIHWTMAGDWLVTVKVTLTDSTIVEATFDQQVIIQGD